MDIQALLDAARKMGGSLSLNIPATNVPADEPDPPASPAPPPAADPIGDADGHSPDFASVRWKGVTYPLTGKQRLVVACLWAARQAGTPDVSADYLLGRCESDGTRLSSLFRRSEAWGTLIVQSVLHGGPVDCYRLG